MCTAVGSEQDTTGKTVALAEAWNGAVWSVQTAPNPSGATDSRLSGVSCSSASACTAVGSYQTTAGSQLTLAEVWNGTAWRIQTTPNPTGATTSLLSAVSCSSPTACTAVGSYQTSAAFQLTLAEAWNGTAWVIQTTPNAATTNANASVLNGVSCSSAGVCMAVGAGNGVTLAEAWNGTVWRIQTTPNPAGSLADVLYGVSCTSAAACTAVGSAEQAPLAEAWNGTAWLLQDAANPAAAPSARPLDPGGFSVLSAVSCTSAIACTAVGTSLGSGAGTEATLAEAWNGTVWSIQPIPNAPDASFSLLVGVSCPSATACTAVGSGGLEPLAEAGDGTTWRVATVPLPDGATNSVLEGVSCRTTTECEAVGYYNDAGDNVPLAETWDGTTWSRMTVPLPAGATTGALHAVSCRSTTACTAVGNYVDSTNTDVTLAETWDGTAWSVQSTPNPPGTTFSVLEGVSCRSALSCTAVGHYIGNTFAGFEMFAETWNGTAWTVQSTPNPAGANSTFLGGVSCRWADVCTAVGSYDDSSGTSVTLAETWNGTAWSIQTTPNPTGATFSVLSGVSCHSATECTAVGNYVNSSGTDDTLAETWNGTAWVIQTTPSPAGATGSTLDSVSCRSATACTAVGSYNNGSGMQFTLAEAWNGTAWSIQTTPNPAGATNNLLSGVSCRSASDCTAVGSYEIAPGVNQTLAQSKRR